MIENIEIYDQIVATIVRHQYHFDGIRFFTAAEDTLQLGYMKRPANYKIQPHLHIPVERTVLLTQEVLYIKNGVVRVNFYDDSKIYHKNVILYKGDIVLLKTAGHGFDIIEDAEIIEIKQGPYAGENDKIKFSPN
jgi:hypothetical protein